MRGGAVPVEGDLDAAGALVAQHPPHAEPGGQQAPAKIRAVVADAALAQDAVAVGVDVEPADQGAGPVLARGGRPGHPRLAEVVEDQAHGPDAVLALVEEQAPAGLVVDGRAGVGERPHRLEHRGPDELRERLGAGEQLQASLRPEHRPSREVHDAAGIDAADALVDHHGAAPVGAVARVRWAEPRERVELARGGQDQRAARGPEGQHGVRHLDEELGVEPRRLPVDQLLAVPDHPAVVGRGEPEPVLPDALRPRRRGEVVFERLARRVEAPVPVGEHLRIGDVVGPGRRRRAAVVEQVGRVRVVESVEHLRRIGQRPEQRDPGVSVLVDA